MSWFDTKGLASLAKNALKNAQKQIDKALDIQEEETSAMDDKDSTRAATFSEKKLPGSASREKSKTEPNTPNVESKSQFGFATDEHVITSSPVRTVSFSAPRWGSFTESFFENPNTSEMVIASAPTNIMSTSLVMSTSGVKRQSMTSNSDSVELLTPTSVCSELMSPSERAIINSESIELITATNTSEITTPDSGSSLPGSIVIIASEEAGDEEDDSLSYNTVMDDTLTSATSNNTLGFLPQQTTTCEALGRSNSSTSTMKTHASMEESQTVDSDSTQSFEDVQMQAMSIECSSREQSLALGAEENIHTKQCASQTYSSSHNSNDEMETATSSDIEIISSPNGDSSSTNSTSRTSPLKQSKQSSQTAMPMSSGSVKKGHYREPSEISILSEDSQSELDKLIYRITELKEMLESREVRLLQLERQNNVLQDRNNELLICVDTMKSNNGNMDSAEEYTQRLSALEKAFQSSIRERDSLLKQIKTLKDEVENKVPKDNLTQVVAESNAMIEELRLEGEKLSKEILQQSNIIKKLRAKEKTSDTLLRKNKDQIALMTDEIERLKKTLNAKEDVERSQIEAVHKMSSENRKLDDENAHHRSKIEDLHSKLKALQASLDAAKSELHQRARLHSDLTHTLDEALAAKKEKEIAIATNEDIMLQLSEVRETLREERGQMIKREQQLREENKELLRRLEAAELRAETSTQEMSLTTIPLVRQLESLQNSLTQHTSHWNKEEKALLEKLDISQTRLKFLENMEVTFKEKNDLLQARCKELEEKLSNSLMHEEKLKISLHQTQLEHSLKESDLNKQITKLNETLDACKDKMKSLDEIVKKHKEYNESLSEIKTDIGVSVLDIQQDLTMDTEVAQINTQQRGGQSPVHSLDKNFPEEALGGSIDWQTDDLDCVSNSGHNTSAFVGGLHLNYIGHNTATLEYLQSLLKQRDGELAQLQWELSRLQAERSLLNEEISNITMELENVKDKLQSYESLEKNFDDLQHRYDALLQMYGEKVERTEELELDLVELKEAYKAQIDELLAQPRTTS